MKQYRKKPVVIEAIQFTHDNAKQVDSIEGIVTALAGGLYALQRGKDKTGEGE